MDVLLIIAVVGCVFSALAGWVIAGIANRKKTEMLVAEKLNLEKDKARLETEFSQLSKQLQQEKADSQGLKQQLAQTQANETELKVKTQVLEAKMAHHQQETEALQEKFNLTFENLANRIFKQKTENFAALNHEKLKPLLEPLSKNLSDFKAKVEEVYLKEAKERFSLGEKVKELAELNRKISAEAHNLTTALKGESKTQGRWGEMILESILEKSGLTKGREYFMEYQLEDENGKALRADVSGKKMRPDALIKYPGNRSIIIDSKVSLNAYSRFVAAAEEEVRRQELSAHIAAIKNHILQLSEKGYDDYASSLDFVLLFIPSESAYMAAIQGDSGLWNFAYDKRILLLSPANLITALKLVVDLWKREYQDMNALQIAEQGGKLYDKFVGFMESMDGIGSSLNKAQAQFEAAHKQLKLGRGSLIDQAGKLKELGVKTKKELNR